MRRDPLFDIRANDIGWQLERVYSNCIITIRCYFRKSIVPFFMVKWTNAWLKSNSYISFFFLLFFFLFFYTFLPPFIFEPPTKLTASIVSPQRAWKSSIDRYASDVFVFHYVEDISDFVLSRARHWRFAIKLYMGFAVSYSTDRNWDRKIHFIEVGTILSWIS